jgi:hypothetical protein
VKQNLEPVLLLDFVQGDFEAAWNALVTVREATWRGNFLFARQAMLLLEIACRLCHSDSSGDALQALSIELERRDSRYFVRLPGSCAADPRDFRLPFRGSDPSHQFVSLLFDLIRNGQAHQYQQIPVLLADGQTFQLGLTGAESGRSLDTVLAKDRPADHLELQILDSGGLWVRIRTDVLYLDIRDSIREARLLDRELSITYLQRPRAGSPHYRFSSVDLTEVLASWRAPVPG